MPHPSRQRYHMQQRWYRDRHSCEHQQTPTRDAEKRWPVPPLSGKECRDPYRAFVAATGVVAEAALCATAGVGASVSSSAGATAAAGTGAAAVAVAAGVAAGAGAAVTDALATG